MLFSFSLKMAILKKGNVPQKKNNNNKQINKDREC